jgi:hypothetical protein
VVLKFLPFVLKHLRATWVRSASTVVAMALCVFLFCTCAALAHFDRFVEGRNPRASSPATHEHPGVVP